MRILLNLSLFSLLLAAGCAPPDAQFKNRAEVGKLYNKAQREVAANLEDHFGAPQELVAWERLPIEWGGLRGSVTETPAGDGNSAFQVTLEDGKLPVWPPENLKAGQELEIQFLSGNYEYVSLNENPKKPPMRILVHSTDPEKNLITIKGQFGEPVAPGSTFVLNPGATLRHGQQLYMEHCMHCHGVSGDGAGPTAPYLNPAPRDYRKGLFKFTSTQGTDKASRNDLARTVKYGIPGTYMPSFALLTPEELEAIVEYVRFLSMRGEYEEKMITYMTGNAWTAEAVAQKRKEENKTTEQLDKELTEYIQGEFSELLNEDADFMAQKWADAQADTSLVKPLTRQSDLIDGIAAWANGGKLVTARVQSVETVPVLFQASGDPLEAPRPEAAPQPETPPQPAAPPEAKPQPKAQPKPEAQPQPPAQPKVTLTVKWSGDSSGVASGQKILWISAGLEGQQSEIAEVNGETVALKEPLASPPAEGAGFVVLQEEVPPVVQYALSSGLDTAKLNAAAKKSAADLNRFLLRESERRGKVLFNQAAVKCADCHGPLGYGNGPQTEAYEDNKETGLKYDHPGLHDDWGNLLQPRDLTTNIYRGGRRPIDLYRRIYAGIKGARMPSLASALVVDGNDYRIWDLVNYVYSIPQEDRERQQQIRKANSAPENSSAEPHNATASREN